MPRMKPDYLERFLLQPFIGVLATLRRDGRPYTVPVWWLLHEGSFWMSGTYDRVWCKQLARDPLANSSWVVPLLDPAICLKQLDDG